MANKAGIFDLETNFAFYGAYHSNPVNIFIHTLFVWPIFFTSLVLLYFTPSIYDISQVGFGDGHGLLLNFGFFFTLIYALFYVGLDKKAGTLAALICFGCWVGASFLAARLGFSLAWKRRRVKLSLETLYTWSLLENHLGILTFLFCHKVVLAAQLFCWTGQFIGHGVFEHRAPALLDNLTQAFLMAPFFVLLEVLQIAFGYEPYSGFHASVKAKIDAEIKEWQDKKQKKST